MGSFYRDIGARMLNSLRESVYRVEAIIGVGLWLLGLFNQQLAQATGTAFIQVGHGFRWWLSFFIYSSMQWSRSVAIGKPHSTADLKATRPNWANS